ncbi:unnamed protein product [Amoebophrya sp. A25]|nr:unnamed protein product [Amoebophrya sp. A25]|eukprot:GSA25T00001462001.1
MPTSSTSRPGSPHPRKNATTTPARTTSTTHTIPSSLYNTPAQSPPNTTTSTSLSGSRRTLTSTTKLRSSTTGVGGGTPAATTTSTTGDRGPGITSSSSSSGSTTTGAAPASSIVTSGGSRSTSGVATVSGSRTVLAPVASTGSSSSTSGSSSSSSTTVESQVDDQKANNFKLRLAGEALEDLSASSTSIGTARSTTTTTATSSKATVLLASTTRSTTDGVPASARSGGGAGSKNVSDSTAGPSTTSGSSTTTSSTSRRSSNHADTITTSGTVASNRSSSSSSSSLAADKNKTSSSSSTSSSSKGVSGRGFFEKLYFDKRYNHEVTTEWIGLFYTQDAVYETPFVSVQGCNRLAAHFQFLRLFLAEAVMEPLSTSQQATLIQRDALFRCKLRLLPSALGSFSLRMRSTLQLDPASKKIRLHRDEWSLGAALRSLPVLTYRQKALVMQKQVRDRFVERMAKWREEVRNGRTKLLSSGLEVRRLCVEKTKSVAFRVGGKVTAVGHGCRNCVFFPVDYIISTKHEDYFAELRLVKAVGERLDRSSVPQKVRSMRTTASRNYTSYKKQARAFVVDDVPRFARHFAGIVVFCIMQVFVVIARVVEFGTVFEQDDTTSSSSNKMSSSKTTLLEQSSTISIVGAGDTPNLPPGVTSTTILIPPTASSRCGRLTLKIKTAASSMGKAFAVCKNVLFAVVELLLCGFKWSIATVRTRTRQLLSTFARAETTLILVSKCWSSRRILTIVFPCWRWRWSSKKTSTSSNSQGGQAGDEDTQEQGQGLFSSSEHGNSSKSSSHTTTSSTTTTILNGHQEHLAGDPTTKMYRKSLKIEAATLELLDDDDVAPEETTRSTRGEPEETSVTSVGE